MNPADLPDAVVRALRGAVADGELAAGVDVPGRRVVVERTRPGGVGDYATAVAFQVAKGARMRPAEVAHVLARRLRDAEAGIERVEVTGAGFICFVLAPLSAPLVIRDVRRVVLPSGSLCVGVYGLRERVVHEVVLRLAPLAPGGFPVAPVAQRDGDVLARFGRDAARWAMLSVPARETPGFSDRLLVQGEENEFFRVRYAYARSRALTRNAADLGFKAEPGDVDDDATELLRVLADHPLVLEAAAHHRAPERLTRHLVELADALLAFQYRVLPQGDEKPSAAHRARLALAEAAGTVLAGGLALLGIDAPERL